MIGPFGVNAYPGYNPNPCRGCGERCMGCHSSCERYKEYDRINQEKRIHRKNEAFAMGALNEQKKLRFDAIAIERKNK